MSRALPILFLLLFATALVAVDESLPLLQVRDYATLVRSNGTQVPGRIIEERDDGVVIFQPTGEERSLRLQPGQYQEIIPPQSVADVVARRSEIMLGAPDGNWSVDMMRTLRWALEQEQPEVAVDLALAAVERYPADRELVQVVVAVLQAVPEREADYVRVLRLGIEHNPSWSDGFELLIGHLRDTGREDELEGLVRRWLERHPSDREANLMVAGMAERRGALAEARSAYRKAYQLHEDREAGTAYARLALRTGEVAEAAEVAADLRAAGHAPTVSAAVLGIAAVHAGDHAAATEHFAAIAGGSLPTDLARLVAYHRGLLELAAGRPEAAVRHWQGLDAPVVELARAIAAGRPAAVAGLSEAHARLARQHNAVLALRERDHAAAQAALGDLVDERSLVLSRIATALAEVGEERAVEALARQDSHESQRWRLYGHLLAQRFDLAAEIASELPPDDDYALVSRIFLAEVRGQRERARALFSEVDGDGTVSAAHLARLNALFDSADNRLRSYDFDWPEGYNLIRGWRSEARGTGIAVAIRDGQLVLAGTQSASAEPVSRAWCLVPSDRLHRAELQLDISRAGSAHAGLELLTEDRRAGVAYAAMPDGRYGWRVLREGRWGSWQAIDRRVDGGQVTFAIEFQPRFPRVLALTADGPVEIGDKPALTGAYLAVGVFGTADPGSEWRIAAQRLRLELHGEDDRPTTTPRRSPGGRP